MGVLITMTPDQSTAWELAYLGLVPSARHQGLGTALTRKVMAEAWAAGAMRVTLTVDGRNQPAKRLYAGLGFAEFERREVYFMRLDTISSSPRSGERGQG